MDETRVLHRSDRGERHFATSTLFDAGRLTCQATRVPPNSHRVQDRQAPARPFAANPRNVNRDGFPASDEHRLEAGCRAPARMAGRDPNGRWHRAGSPRGGDYGIWEEHGELRPAKRPSGDLVASNYNANGDKRRHSMRSWGCLAPDAVIDVMCTRTPATLQNPRDGSSRTSATWPAGQGRAVVQHHTSTLQIDIW